jgi:hypothetical protein
MTVRQLSCQRRLQQGERLHEVGTVGGQLQGDDRAGGVTGDMRALGPMTLNRCRRAGVPATVRFATTIVLAPQLLLTRAFAAAVPARWVAAASFDGRSHAFRQWQEEHGQASVLMVPDTHRCWCPRGPYAVLTGWYGSHALGHNPTQSAVE